MGTELVESMNSATTQNSFSAFPEKPRRRVPRRFKVFLTTVLLILLCLPPLAHSQSQPQSQPESKNESDSVDLEHIESLLILITQQEDQIKLELDELSQQPVTPSSAQRKDALLKQLDQAYLNFDGVATQHDTSDLFLSKKEGGDWIKEIEELSLPLLHALSDLTKKPRRIDKLKKNIDSLKSKITRLEDASEKIELLLKKAEIKIASTPEEKNYLKRLKRLKNKYAPELARLELREVQKNLDHELADKRPILDVFAEGTREFFRHRGRNLLIILSSFAALWWVLTKLRNLLVGRRNLLNLHPRIIKVVRAAYTAVVLVLCVSLSLVALYLLNDWLLLSISIIVLVAIGWTSRQLIPIFFREFQLSLNLGTVRENERLLWQGVPWLVKSLGISARLVNDRLEGGTIVLPLRKLIDEQSRPAVKDEPWFPTELEDWVTLSDGTYGKVERQTLEQVILRLKGGALKYYLTADFIKQNPVNLSRGFRYSIDFGLDYGVQSRICGELPELFEQGLRRLLSPRLQGEPPEFLNLDVAFEKADASSLVLKILVEVDGSAAEFYEEYEREVQSALIRICNENNLTIPFRQVTLNLPDDESRLARFLESVPKKNPLGS